MAVGKFHLPAYSGVGNATPEPYIRPADWLSIDHLVVSGDQKVVILVAVFEEGNFIGLECNGNYTVNFGDGNIVNGTAGVDTYYQYDWNNPALNGTLTSRGYKQAILTITPQAGQNLTVVRLNKKNFAQAGLFNGYTHPWLDIKMSGQFISQLRIGTGTGTDPLPRLLEQFDWIGPNQLNSALNIFNGAYALKQVKNLDTSLCTSFNSFFGGCYELEHIPFFNTSQGTSFVSTFAGCYKLKSVPAFDLSKATALNAMFQNCVSIVEFPNFNCSLSTNFATMFDGCRSMLKSPALILSTTLSKNFSSMFSNCVSMVEFTNMNTMQASTYAQMFLNCHSLRIIPNVIDTTGTISTQFNNMFQNCYDLEKAPMMDLSKGQNCSSIFASCWSITEFPAYDFSSVTSLTSAFGTCTALKRVPVMTIGSGITSFNTCFTTCISLEEAPNWNLQNATDVTNMFNGCLSLRKIPAYNLSSVTLASANMFASNLSLIQSDAFGMRYTHSYINCRLSRTELVKIFNNLGTAVGAPGTQIINISGNYGASQLTLAERAIATGKGWGITG